jgi:hypothetical protein
LTPCERFVATNGQPVQVALGNRERRASAACWKELADENARFADEFGLPLLTKRTVFISKHGGDPA